MERIWEKDYGPFRVFGYVAPEEMDISEIFDEDAGYHIDGLRNDIEQGNKIWVCAYAKVYCKVLNSEIIRLVDFYTRTITSWQKRCSTKMFMTWYTNR